MTDAEPGFTPPYISFETFRNFIVRLGEKPIPPRIDRSMMVGMAGGTQTYLLQALRGFDLIGDANEVQPALVGMAQGEDGFATGLRDLLQRFYAPQLQLAEQQATAAQLTESFAPSGYTGSTLRKAVTFFLHAARAADLPLSPHFRAPVQRAPGTKARRPARPRPRGAGEPASEVPTAVASAAESHTIRLASGGTVTLSCSTSFLALSREDRAFLFELVDKLRDYEAEAAATPPSPASEVCRAAAVDE